MSNIRKKAIAGLQVGDTFTVSRSFSEEEVLRFADLSQDYNPVHFDERFAHAKGFASRICHGLLVAGIMTEIGGQIGWLAASMDFQFKRPVYFHETVCCTFTITELDEKGWARAEYVFKNEDQATVLEGAITGILPGPVEKEVMNHMVAEGDPTNPLRNRD